MAEPAPGTTYNVGDPAVQENWDKEIVRHHQHRTVLFSPDHPFIGEGEEKMIQVKTEPFNEAGTRATLTLIKQLAGAPTYGKQLMERRGEGIRDSTFRFEITKVRHAVQVIGELTKHRVSWNVVKTSSLLLGEWGANEQEYAAFMHMAGFNIDAQRGITEPNLNGTDLGRTWGNAPARPDAQHALYVNNKIPGNFTDTDIIDMPVFSDAKALAETLPQPLRPIRIYGDDMWPVFVHPYTVRHWKDSGTRWWEVATKAMEGGLINGHPIVRGTLGVYDNFCFFSSKRVPPAIDDSTITAMDGTAAVLNSRCAIVCGQQALGYGQARRYRGESVWRRGEQIYDFGDKLEIEVHTLGGLACPVWELDGTTQRFSTIVIYGYAKDLITPA